MTLRRLAMVLVVTAVLVLGCSGGSTSAPPLPELPDDLPASPTGSDGAENGTPDDAISVADAPNGLHLAAGTGTAASIVFLSDGFVATGGASDGTVRIWDPVNSDEPVATFSGHVDRVSHIVELPDGKMLSSAALVRIWKRTDDGPQLQGRFTQNRGRVTGLGVLPDGRVVSSGDTQALLWEAGDPETTLGTYEGHRNPTSALAVLADGRVATGDAGGELHMWWPDDPADASIFECQCGTIRAIRELPNGTVAVGGNQSVAVFNPEALGDAFLTFSVHDDAVNSLDVFEDGRIVSASDDSTIRVWDPQQPTDESMVVTHNASVEAIAIAPDGRFVAGTGNGLYMFNVENPDVIDEQFFGHEATASHLVELSDGRIAVASDDLRVRIWNLDSPDDPEAIYSLHEQPVAGVAEIPNGRMASISVSGRLHTWSPDDVTKTVSAHDIARTVSGRPASLPDGRLVIPAGAGVVVLDADDPDRGRFTYRGHSDPVRAVAVLDDGRVASVSDGTVHVWDPDSDGTDRAIYSAHESSVEALAELSDGRIVSGGRAQELHVWHPDEPQTTLMTIPRRGQGLRAVVELSDGRIATAGSSTAVFTWEFGPSAVTQTGAYTDHSITPEDMIVLADGRVASAAGDGVRVWSPPK